MPRLSRSYSKVEARRCVDKALEIFDRQRLECLNLRDQILSRFGGDINEFTASSLATFYVLVAMQLTGQIQRSLRQGCTTISIIGYRTLLEHEINSRYIYRHPNHKKSKKWVDSLRSDFWDRSKSKVAIKNRLGDKSVMDRAIEVGRKRTYNTSYAWASNFPHTMAAAMTINNDHTFLQRTVEISLASLAIFHNVCENVAAFYDLSRDFQLEQDLRNFISSYK